VGAMFLEWEIAKNTQMTKKRTFMTGIIEAILA
jgi:hypothetical protein